MRNLFKLLVIGVFALVSFAILLNKGIVSKFDSVSAQTTNTAPTPPANTNVPKTNSAANVSTGGKTIPDDFVLGQDSISEYGEVPFSHKTHAFSNYNPDGKSVTACVVCHHTDQPKSAMSPPLVTSTRDVVLTMAVFQASAEKVLSCRACHFQEGSVPDGKEMPTIVSKKDGSEESKEYNNELAYHINCNTCHDEAARLRPELKKKSGFATTKDCNICHKSD